MTFKKRIDTRYWKLVIFVSKYGNLGYATYWNRFQHERKLGVWSLGGEGKAMRQSHIDHIVESQDAVGFHHAIHAVRHPVCPLGHAHGIGRGDGVGTVWLPDLVAGVGH